MSTITVWIADDDPFYHSDMKAVLEDDGFEVGSFHTAAELLGALKETPSRPDVIVVDMMLPYDTAEAQQDLPPDLSDGAEVTGVRLTRELLALGFPARKIVAITALPSPRHLQPLRAAGMEDWQILHKPARVIAILEALRRASAR